MLPYWIHYMCRQYNSIWVRKGLGFLNNANNNIWPTFCPRICVTNQFSRLEGDVFDLKC